MGFGNSSLDFVLRVWTTSDQFVGIKSDLNIEIERRLGEMGVEIPFPQRVVHMQAEAGESDAG